MKACYHKETYLTDEILQELGFYVAKDFLGHKSWRLKVPYYTHLIQITIRPDLHRTNPNCGVFSLVIPEISGDDGHESGYLHQFNRPETTINVAYHVDTAERLYALITIITHSNLY